MRKYIKEKKNLTDKSKHKDNGLTSYKDSMTFNLDKRSKINFIYNNHLRESQNIKM